jgi:hypothetical protein
MKNLKIHAAWTLAVTFSLSIIYEIWRSTAMAGTSEFDNMQAFWALFPLYIVGALMIFVLFKGYRWASWAGFIFSVVLILVSIFYYNPVMMLVRKPELIDWFEDFAYTGLLFVTGTMLYYDIKEKSNNLSLNHALTP